MFSSILYRYFKTLTKKDRRELSKFVNSPFHNQRKEVIRLFHLLDEQIDNVRIVGKKPNGEDKMTHPLRKEAAFKAVFPDKTTANDAQMRTTMSQLVDLIEDYFVCVELKNNKQYASEKALVLRHALLLRGYKEDYEHALNYDFENIKNVNRRYNFHRYTLLAERSFWQGKDKRSADLYYNDMCHTLDSGYVIELLRLACSMQSHKNLINRDYDLKILDFVLKEIENGWMNDHIVVQAFYYAYRTILLDKDSFEVLEQLLDEHFDDYSSDESHFLFKVIINYLTRFINLGQSECIPKVWRYFRKGIDTGILIQNNIISPADFLTIVSLGVSSVIQEVDWVDEFIQSHKMYLPHKDKENYLLFIDGIYHFYLKNYQKSMVSLKKVTFEDEYEQMRCRRMLAVMYYELNEFSVLHSHLEAFKMYIHRQKTMGYQRESHLNFIRFLEKLMKINVEDDAACLLLWEQIKKAEPVTLNTWFKAKLLKNSEE
ncbi:MAG: hypothetical protein JNL70_17075 [Saprospiraceae bacterium]|nr:hypothetical protein [Saprospiraceae bacterium]